MHYVSKNIGQHLIRFVFLYFSCLLPAIVFLFILHFGLVLYVDIKMTHYYKCLSDILLCFYHPAQWMRKSILHPQGCQHQQQIKTTIKKLITIKSNYFV